MRQILRAPDRKWTIPIQPRLSNTGDIEDLWDFINQRCPLSHLEAVVLIGRYIQGKGERELAAELGIPWRRLNRAAFRMKAKLRHCEEHLRLTVPC